MGLAGCAKSAPSGSPVAPPRSPAAVAETSTPAAPSMVAAFDPAVGELPEGVATKDGFAYVGFAPLERDREGGPQNRLASALREGPQAGTEQGVHDRPRIRAGRAPLRGARVVRRVRAARHLPRQRIRGRRVALRQGREDGVPQRARLRRRRKSVRDRFGRRHDLRDRTDRCREPLGVERHSRAAIPRGAAARATRFPSAPTALPNGAARSSRRTPRCRCARSPRQPTKTSVERGAAAR
jgi:hypothetical protein